ncbi:MAG: DUF6263 family protein [Planctomycetota bacterium]
MSTVRISYHLLLLLIAARAQAADQPLVWKFQPGQQLHYRMTQRMDTQMALGAAQRTLGTGVEQVIDMTWQVQQVEGNQATIRQTFDRVRMNMQSPDQPDLKYDSDSDEDPTGFAAMLSSLYKAMRDEAIEMKMTSRGKIFDVSTPETLTTAIEGVPGARMMGDMFSKEGFNAMVQKNSLVLPKPKELSPGHEWTTQSELKSPQLGAAKFEITYRYLGPREIDDTELEVFSANMKADFGEGIDGVQITVVDQDSSGEILFDRQRGRLESSNLQQEIEMEVLVGGQLMRQKMTQKILFERLEKP